MLNENNASIRPEIIKTLPKVKSDWSLECFTNREDANYKLLVKDIKKTIKAGSKSTATDNGYQNTEEKQPHGGELTLSHSFGPILTLMKQQISIIRH